MQHNQTMEQVNTNSLRYLTHPLMVNRVVLEDHNYARQEANDRRGILKSHYQIALSLVPDSMTRPEAKAEHFFTETMTAAFQAVEETDAGNINLYAAFVAGAHEQTADEEGNLGPEYPRFDIDAVKMVCVKLGIDYGGADTEEILVRPILIQKELLPNGLVDFVKMYDDVLQEMTGNSYFYGRPHSGPKDYIRHREECLRRQENVKEGVDDVVDRLIAEKDQLPDAVAVTNRIDELNDAWLKEQIIVDHSIDANVLGPKATHSVKVARMAYVSGDTALFKQHYDIVQKDGASSSCPGNRRAAENGDIFGEKLLLSPLENDDDANEQVVDDEEVEMTCPFCKEKVLGNPCADAITCSACNANSQDSESINKAKAARTRLSRLREARDQRVGIEDIVLSILETVGRTTSEDDTDTPELVLL